MIARRLLYGTNPTFAPERYSHFHQTMDPWQPDGLAGYWRTDWMLANWIA